MICYLTDHTQSKECLAKDWPRHKADCKRTRDEEDQQVSMDKSLTIFADRNMNLVSFRRPPSQHTNLSLLATSIFILCSWPEQ